MSKTLATLFLSSTLLGVQPGIAQDQSRVPLCDLQTQIAQGEHRIVTVEGIYQSGLEHQLLIAEHCMGAKTRVDFELRDRRLWAMLVRMTNKTNRQRHVVGAVDPVLVVFKGEFYGPPRPDAGLPENIRGVYHPGWDDEAMTKIIVHEIISVKIAPRQ